VPSLQKHATEQADLLYEPEINYEAESPGTGDELLSKEYGRIKKYCRKAQWPLSRRPYLLETSLPSVFAAGIFAHAMSRCFERLLHFCVAMPPDV
jgi:hypothetical protein